jgi:hypothetical protein
MNDHSILGRDTFQQLLASAFAVQQSQLDRQSLSAILDVQRSIASGKFDLDSAMLSIVSSARDVAHASGVGIGLLKSDRITYCAGCGTSAALVGQHVVASLTVSAFTKATREILRVENAQRDSRIEADICRQFGASALLILPIYFDHVVAGVLEVRFSEPHAFQDREVRTYVLMAEQIEAALSKASEAAEPANSLAAEFAPALNDAEGDPEYAEPLEDEAPSFWMGESSVPSFFERCQYKLATAKESPAFQRSILFVDAMLHRARTLAVHRPAIPFLQPAQIKQWTVNQRAKSLAAAQRTKHLLASQWLKTSARLRQANNFTSRPGIPTTALVSAVAILAVSALISYESHRASSMFDPSALSKGAPIESEAASKPLPGKAEAQPELLQAKEVSAGRISRKHIRLADGEVQYFGDDVTVHLFSARTAAQRTVIPKSRVAHIGKDVTIRYFASPEPAVIPVSH